MRTKIVGLFVCFMGGFDSIPRSRLKSKEEKIPCDELKQK